MSSSGSTWSLPPQGSTPTFKPWPKQLRLQPGIQIWFPLGTVEPAGAGSLIPGLLEPLCGVGGVRPGNNRGTWVRAAAPLRSWLGQGGGGAAECGLEAEP